MKNKNGLLKQNGLQIELITKGLHINEKTNRDNTIHSSHYFTCRIPATLFWSGENDFLSEKLDKDYEFTLGRISPKWISKWMTM